MVLFQSTAGFCNVLSMLMQSPFLKVNAAALMVLCAGLVLIGGVGVAASSCIIRILKSRSSAAVRLATMASCETIPSKAVLQTRTRQGVKLVHRCRDKNDVVKAQDGKE